MREKVRIGLIIAICGLFLVSLTGCGSVQHSMTLEKGYVPNASSKVVVGKVTNETGKQFDVDVENLLSDALAEKLRRQSLLSSGEEPSNLVLTCKIVEYEKGNAFQRWLLPGWGSTVLSIQGNLRDKDNLVGTVKARRTISIGGGYTIGAWRTVFADLADDVAGEIHSSIAKSNAAKK